MQSAQWAAQVPLFESQPGFAQTFMPGGRAPRPGELVTLPDHATTLQTIATTTGESFYRGELAARLEAHSTANGGAMRATEQIDALQTLSTDPFRYLIAPRLAAA